jgi:hypothetical protein
MRQIDDFINHVSSAQGETFLLPVGQNMHRAIMAQNRLGLGCPYFVVLEAATRWEGYVVRMGGGRRNACRILVGKPEGKRPLGRPSHRWVNNIKMHLREIGWHDVDVIDLAQDRDQWRALLSMVMNLWVP